MLVDRNRTLEHGTLLFTSQMTDLSAALRINPLKFVDKAVKSIRSRVTNISEHLPVKMDVSQFRTITLQYMQEHLSGYTLMSLARKTSKLSTCLKSKNMLLGNGTLANHRNMLLRKW